VYILDLVGTTEPCQVTIAEDELYEIDKDRDKRIIYVTGYENDSTTSRTADGGKKTRHSVDYQTFSFKIFSAEQGTESKSLSGFNDRTFFINSYKGTPQFHVKVFTLQKMPPEYQAMLNEMDDFHKLMLIYRIIHSEDNIDFAKTNINDRAWELTQAIIDIFSFDLFSPTKKARDEILPVLSKYLQRKGELNKRTLEYFIYDVLTELFSKITQDTIEISHSDICDEVIKKSDGKKIIGKEAFYSSHTQKVSFTYLYKRCREFFGAKDTFIGPNDARKRAFSFERKTLKRLESQFTEATEIRMLMTMLL
jgi:hypothetical protein